jgi:hypothetical protein
MKIRLLLFAIAMLVLLVPFIIATGVLRSPDAALEEFYTRRDAAEDQLADPLIVTGCRSAHLVAREIANPEMRYRRYAISYLGNRRCRAAEAALVKIVEDPREEALFRADALEAITRIDPQRGLRLAATYSLHDQSIGLDRSYWQALRGAHE